MRAGTLALIAIAVFSPAVGCRTAISVLELRDVCDFAVVETHVGEARRLELSGRAFHSALAVDGIRTPRQGSDLVVRIILVFTEPGLSSRFDYTVNVADDVARVLFGEEQIVIWPPSAKGR